METSLDVHAGRHLRRQPAGGGQIRPKNQPLQMDGQANAGIRRSAVGAALKRRFSVFFIRRTVFHPGTFSIG